MYKYFFFITVLCAQYDDGDQISIDHQNTEFSYCYPSDSTSIFSLSQHVGKVFVLDISASW